MLAIRAVVLFGAVALATAACSARSNGSTGESLRNPDAHVSAESPQNAVSKAHASPSAVSQAPGADAGACTLTEHPGALSSGGSLSPRPAGSVLRLLVSWQGPRIALAEAKGVNMVVGPSEPQLSSSPHAGYWFELRDADEHVLFTTLVRDPAVLEGFTSPTSPINVDLPWCDEKTLDVSLPNDPRAKAIVFFGSPYGKGNVGAPASELARFRVS